jgi:hypothetical protein
MFVLSMRRHRLKPKKPTSPNLDEIATHLRQLGCTEQQISRHLAPLGCDETMKVFVSTASSMPASRRGAE